MKTLIILLPLLLGGCGLAKTTTHYVETGETKWPGGWSDKKAQDGYDKANKDRYGLMVPTLLLLGLLSRRRAVNPLSMK